MAENIKILVINCGSSTVKFQLMDMTEEKVLASGLIDRLGQKKSIKKYKFNEISFNEESESLDHSTAIAHIIEAISNSDSGVIKNRKEIKAVGHRVAHGADKFTDSALINEGVIKEIRDCCVLAPLHNPHNLKGIEVCKNLLPGIPQAAVFDTAFHQTIEDYVYMYALPYKFYEKHRFRRYGFHGTSHKYVANKAAEFLKKDVNKLKIITCHLGNGASIAAVKNGKSVDTSMGFTPLEGLIMGTRCGDVDPAMPLFVMEKENLSSKECDSLMNKECGLLGISGISSDMRDIIKEYEKGNKRARLALRMYAYRIKKYIGMYSAAMNGVDVLVFTGGIGENALPVRSMCCEDMQYLGIEFSKDRNNDIKGKLGELNSPSSRVKILCIPTNEELVIARDTLKIINNHNK